MTSPEHLRSNIRAALIDSTMSWPKWLLFKYPVLCNHCIQAGECGMHAALHCTGKYMETHVDRPLVVYGFLMANLPWQSLISICCSANLVSASSNTTQSTSSQPYSTNTTLHENRVGMRQCSIRIPECRDGPQGAGWYIHTTATQAGIAIPLLERFSRLLGVIDLPASCQIKYLHWMVVYTTDS